MKRTMGIEIALIMLLCGSGSVGLAAEASSAISMASGSASVDSANPMSACKRLTLDEAVTTALANSPVIRESESRERTAKAGARGAAAPLRPQASLETRRSWVSEVGEVSIKLPLPNLPPMSPMRLGNQDLWATTVTLRQLISSGGKFEALKGQAEALAQASRQLLTRVRQVTAFEARRAFLLLLSAQNEETVASSAVSTAESYVQVAQARLKERAGAKFDVLRAEVQREEARQDLVRASSGIETARAALQAALGLTGRSDRIEAVEPQPDPEQTPVSLEEALTTAFRDRPELSASVSQMRAAQRGISAARAERRPQISMAADYQQVQPESPATVSRWSTVLVAGMPLFDGGQIKSRVSQAEAQRDQVAAARDSLETTIEKEVRQAHARMTSAANQVCVARNRVELAEEMLRVTRVRAESGVSTATEVSDAQTSLTRARQGMIRAESDLRIARAELNLAMGRE